MKLTKQIKAELATAYRCAMEVSILDMKAPLRYINQYIAEDVNGYGTAADEKVRSRKDFRKMAMDLRRQSKGLMYKAKVITPYRPKFINETTAQFRDEIEVQNGDKKYKHTLNLWISTLYKYHHDKWQMVFFHSSVPDTGSSSADTFHVGEAEKKLKELEQVVAQRTAALQTKTRELEIESSLERIRTVTMGMNTSGDILNICKVFFTELQTLGFKDLRNALINFWDDKNGVLHDYDYSDFSGGNFAKLAYSSHPAFEQFQKKIRKAKDAFAKLVIKKDGLKSWQQRRRSSGEYKDPRLNKISALYYYFYSTGVGALGISTFSPISKDEVELLKKFRNVFDLAYKRYADITNAEAQARTAQIELSVERVRARALAMYRSSDILDVVKLLRKELVALQIPGVVATTIYLKQTNGDVRLWDITSVEDTKDGIHFSMDFNFRMEEAAPDLWIRKIWDAVEDYIVIEENKKDLRRAVAWNRRYNEVAADMTQKFIEANQIVRAWHPAAKLLNGKLVTDFILPPPDEMSFILPKMGAAFDLAYKRFLDLQKAEAQAREAQIETALEKVRSRSLAMHKSDELKEVIRVVLEQFINLKINAEHAGFYIDYKAQDDMHIWLADPNLEPFFAIIPYFDTPTWNSYLEAKAKGTALHTDLLNFKEKNKFYKSLFKLFEIPEEAKKFYLQCKGLAVSTVLLDTVGLYIENFSAIPYTDDENKILMRFGKVFQQTYTRFLDLQKAEAQARESQIETALEKVRSRSLAMHKSDELKEVIRVVLEQFVHLNINAEHAGFYIDYKVHDDMHIWLADPNLEPFFAIIPYFDTPTWNSFLEAKAKGITFHTNLLNFKEKNKFYKSLFRLFKIPEEAKKFYLQCKGLAVSTVLLDNVGLYIENFSAIPYTDEENKILMRFGKVFQQAYTRFLDLQKAEAQAREAQIEAALERVRSASMAMHNSDELQNVIKVVTDQLTAIGFMFDTANFIVNDSIPDWEMWLSSPGSGGLPPKMYINYFDHPLFNERNNAFRDGESFLTAYLNKEEKNIFLQYLFENTLARQTPEDRKKWILDQEGMGLTTVLMQNISLSVVNYTARLYTEQENEVIRRFAYVFEQSYTRFLDLQKAEAQARESQIQLALERVRARTMAMQRSDELSETAAVLFNEFKKLGDEELIQVTIGVYNEAEGTIEFRSTSWAGGGEQFRHAFTLSMYEPTLLQPMITAWKAKKKSNIVDLTGDKLEDWIKYRNANTGVTVSSTDTQGRRVITAAFFSKGHLSLSSPLPLQEDTVNTLERFANVFDSTYTRFSDLQKAEAQAREAQIEASLERIRAKSMSMHRSDELDEVLVVLWEQFYVLGIRPMSTHMTLIDIESNTFTFRETGKGGHRSYGEQVVAIDSMDIWKNEAEKWRTSEPLSINRLHFPKESLPMLWQVFHESFASMPDDAKIVPEDYPDGIYHTAGNCKFGYIGMNQTRKATLEEEEIVLKFATEFGRFYQRFLDLKKAEAQTREAQIEAGLERVRSRTLAMHKSDELAETAAVMFRQLIELGITPNRLFIGIIKDIEDEAEFWITDEDGSQVSMAYTAKLNENASTKKMLDGWKDKKQSQIIDMQGSELQEYFTYLTNLKVPFKGGLEQKRRIQHLAYFGKGFIGMASPDEQPKETMQLLERFAAVFNLTYTRFNDLQVAEAQAREAQIEAALERVRSRAMAMQTSEELNVLIGTVFTELTKLDLSLTRCAILIYDSNEKGLHQWMINAETPSEPMSFYITHADLPYLNALKKAWKQKLLQWNYILEGEDKFRTDEFLLKQTELNQLPGFVIDAMRAPGKVHISASFNNFGCVTLASLEPLPGEHFDILLRFAKVFDLTYTRFNDLQIAEAQTREAVIEASLERMRSVAMSIRKSEELIQVAESLYKELRALGVSNIRNAQIVIKTGGDELYLVCVFSEESSEVIKEFRYDTSPITQKMYTELEASSEALYQREITGMEFEQWVQWRKDTGAKIETKLLEARSVTFCLYSIGEGHLGISAYNNITGEQLNILKRFRNVFELSYRRFMDVAKSEEQALKLQQEKNRLENALNDLQSTQKQLIQSEKMASLGELTAGIAHEIQNPLNFVNNFSEVSKELLGEMKEAMEKGNTEDAKEIMNDVIQNLEKINHHGKRADGIVKGMLQHSRAGSGQKELTDINVLADEYLRLSYHGLRAKDKSFNAKFETDFDENVGKISVMPQDIGRVILNLINNAFYAAPLPPEEGFSDPNYKHVPTVWVSTRKLDDKVLISVKDNGPGIPQKILEKIFQPFFTTKPTGQGTGLGLSLSYDIVKAHGGELKVETKEGEGTEFVIVLPLG